MPLQDSDFRTIGGQEVALNPDYNGGCYTFRHRNGKGKVTGYSNLGFDVCLERIARYAAWADEKAGTVSLARIHANHKRGSFDAFQAHQDLSAMCMEMARHLPGGKCDADLSPQLKGLEGKRVEVVDKFGETRRFYVGKSMGPMVIHLELRTSRSSGGMGADREYKSVQVV